jgi:bacillithiol biosynthesis cysteine-adding enzyme BshC
LHQTSFKKVNETLPLIKNYSIQVNPREINLFYIQDQLRERIIYENGNYKINNTLLSFSESELLTELENNPENFSPNVILRPLYQEVVLPNLCYIGGGGEIAYWLELKSNFEAHKITFPILLVRNSVLLVTKKQLSKLEKLNLNWKDIFLNRETLLNNKTKELSKFTVDFSEQKEILKKQFKLVNEIANQTDPSFLGAVKAQEVKQLKGLYNLEKRLLKAEKRIYKEKLERITQIQNQLFPNQGLQERTANFSSFCDEIDSFDSFLDQLQTELQPLSHHFSVVNL